MCLHAAKWPSSSVGGYIVGTPTANATRGWSSVDVSDVIPICHNIPVGPILEVGAQLVEADLQAPLAIVGFYWAPQEMPLSSSSSSSSSSCSSSSASVDERPFYISKVISVIRANAGGNCVLVTMRNEVFGSSDALCIEAHLHDNSKCSVQSTETASALQSALDKLLAVNKQRQLIDLEDHMDSPGGTLDFRNKGLC